MGKLVGYKCPASKTCTQDGSELVPRMSEVHDVMELVLSETTSATRIKRKQCSCSVTPSGQFGIGEGGREGSTLLWTSRIWGTGELRGVSCREDG